MPPYRPHAQPIGLSKTRLNALEVLYLELQVHDLLVAHRIHTAIYVHHVSVVEAAEHMQYGVAFAYVGQELVAKAFATAGSAHKAGYVHDIHSGRYGALGFADFAQGIEPAVGHVGAAEVGLNSAEREVGGLRPSRTYTIEKGGFAHIGQPHYSALETH